MSESRIDPVTFEVIWHRLLDLTEEMGIKYMRTSGSQVLLTGYDASTGITLPNGNLVAMGPYITTQGNVLPVIIDSTIRLNQADPGIGVGDMFMCNDPFLGATHGPDVATVAPVHQDGELVAWVGASGHWLDIGGIDPGGFCIRAVETHEEGLRMPAVKLVEGGVLRADVERWIMNQVRDPLTGLDIRGQIAANNAGRDGLEALFARYGLDTVQAVMYQSIDYAEQRFRERLRSLPDGEWREIQYIDHDGHNDRVYKIVCRMTKRGDSIKFDFSETDPQAPGFINCTFSGLRAGILSGLYILLGWDLPWNHGISRCVEIVCPPGLIVNAQYPAATSMATIGVIILVIDTVFRPLSQLLSLTPALRDEAMAVWTGTSLAPVVSGINQRGFSFANTEMSHFAGGSGARTYRDGMDTGGIIFNTTPSIPNIETAEDEYPLLYLFRRQLEDSGGAGRYRGGVSGELAYVPHDVGRGSLEASFAGGGAEQPNGLGLSGGLPGATVRVMRVRDAHVAERVAAGEVPPSTLSEASGQLEVLVQKHSRSTFSAEDIWYHNWQGGGGFGDPIDRDPEAVLRDVAAELVSPGVAKDIYGVIIKGGAVDPVATLGKRAEIRDERVAGAVLPSVKPTPPSEDSLRYGDHLTIDLSQNVMACGQCGRQLGSASDDFRENVVRRESPLAAAGPVRGQAYDKGRFQLVTYHCPGCATQFEADVEQMGAPHPWFRLAGRSA